jgi:hypothetical protein
MIRDKPLAVIRITEAAMNETYRCPDGREALLAFNEDTLKVVASTPEGLIIGSYQFALIGTDGENIDLMDDPGEPVSIKLAESHLADAWCHQGISERVIRLVADETMISPPIRRLRN